MSKTRLNRKLNFRIRAAMAAAEAAVIPVVVAAAEVTQVAAVDLVHNHIQAAAVVHTQAQLPDLTLVPAPAPILALLQAHTRVPVLILDQHPVLILDQHLVLILDQHLVLTQAQARIPAQVLTLVRIQAPALIQALDRILVLTLAQVGGTTPSQAVAIGAPAHTGGVEIGAATGTFTTVGGQVLIGMLELASLKTTMATSSPAAEKKDLWFDVTTTPQSVVAFSSDAIDSTLEMKTS